MTEWRNLRINAQRLRDDFSALSEIGSTGDGGVNRPTFSEAHFAARRWLLDRAHAASLETQIDAAGNHSARLPAADPHTLTLLIGSHLDSVPFGGRFDGALGVLAALEVLRTVKEAGLTLPVHLEAIDFTDEESTLVALLGSRALAGQLTERDLQQPRGGRAALLAGLQHAGLTEAGLVQAARSPATLAGYLELHIEQSERLIDADQQIGIVSALVGIHAYVITFQGRADHAGTTPLTARADAGLGAAAFMLAARQHVLQHFPGAVMNVGRLHLHPGAYNIVPERAELGLEFRAESDTRLEELQVALLALAEQIAEDYGLGLSAEQVAAVPAAACAPSVRQSFATAADSLGLRHTELLSYAGHDTMSLAAICPAGMIFIPSTGGSHSHREHAAWHDCLNGANVLLRAALTLALA